MRSVSRTLFGFGDPCCINDLLPIRRAAAANPAMGSGHRATEMAGDLGRAEFKTFVPGHGQTIPPKKKYAMRKIVLAM